MDVVATKLNTIRSPSDFLFGRGWLLDKHGNRIWADWFEPHAWALIMKQTCRDSRDTMQEMYEVFDDPVTSRVILICKFCLD